MHRNVDAGAKIALRPPEQVMRLDRMGTFHQSRLSFMRVLLRRMKRENWTFDRPKFELDEKGVGTALYRAKGPARTYTLVAFSHDLPADKRSDRVIADAWDATFTLVDGEASDEDINRLRNNVPLQEAGRISSRELTLSRANKSVRMFEHVKERLSQGQQPDLEQILSVGYLMRTTAVYGSGKFGAADREEWGDRDEFRGSFQPELLTVWLIRAFTIDLVEHLASANSPSTAVRLDPEIRRNFGVGNSTGLGMAPFLINHPALIHAWIHARETALARVRSVEFTSVELERKFEQLVKRALVNAEGWLTAHAVQKEKCENLVRDLNRSLNFIKKSGIAKTLPWDSFYRWAESSLTLEGQEQIVSLLLELHPDMTDDLADKMCADETALYRIDGKMRTGDMIELITKNYSWALDLDIHSKDTIARVWYVSEEKLEPRLGERFDEELEPYEQPLAPGRDAKQLYEALQQADPDELLGTFLMRHPRYRHAVRRIQHLSQLPYGEVQDNTIDANMMPIDLLRCKLSFFGATKFDPRSDRWVRITMYQGAPFPDDIHQFDPDELAYPPLDAE